MWFKEKQKADLMNSLDSVEVQFYLSGTINIWDLFMARHLFPIFANARLTI